MATVTFSNGATAEFNGTPTAADINEVAKTPAVANYKAKPTLGNLTSNSFGIVKNVANAISTPLESVAAWPVQALASATGQPDPYRNGIPNLSGNVPILPGSDVLGKLGQVGQVASNVIAPESAGMIKLGLLGGISGLSQSLAAGNRDPGQVAQDTLSGVGYGSALGIAGNFIGKTGGLLKGNSGMSPQLETELKNAPSSLINSYADTAINHESDIRTPTAHALAEQAAQARAKILVKQVIPQAGQAVGAAKKAAGDLPISLATDASTPPAIGIDAAHNITANIGQKVEDMTGFGFGTAHDNTEGLPGLPGTQGESTPIVRQLPGSYKELSDADVGRLQKLQGYLDLLKAKPNVGTASDIIHNLEQDINRNTPTFGAPQTPVNGALKYASHAINDAIRGASPALADANSTYHDLMELKGQITDQAGSDFQNASLMMRRVVSGDKSADAINTLDNLSKVTQPYATGPFFEKNSGAGSNLVTHAMLADWATKNFGGASARTLLNQYTNEGASMVGYASRIAKTILKEAASHMTPDSREYALAVAKGQPYSLNPLTRLAENVMKSAETKPFIGAVAKYLSAHGINPTNAEGVVDKLVRASIFQALTSPTSQNRLIPESSLQQLPSSPPQDALQPAGIPAPNVQSQGPSSRALSSGVNKASSTALKGLTAPTSGQAMSANLRNSLSPGNGLSGSGLSLS